MWQFPLAMFIASSIMIFLSTIFDKKLKQFDILTRIIGSIIMGMMTGVFAFIVELIKLLVVYWLIK